MNTTIAAFCQAFDHYFRFEKRNLWIESGLNQEGADKSSEDCLCSQVLKLITFLEKRNKNRYRRSININGNEDVIQSVTQATRRKNSSTPKRSRTYELL